MAQVDYFLKIDGIDGESTDAKHTGWIDVLSYKEGLANPSQRNGGGQGFGRVVADDFSITKRLDKTSPKLALACASGDHIKEVTLELVRVGRQQQAFLSYKLTDVLVTSVRDAGSNLPNPETGGDPVDPLPTEQLSLKFTKIQFSFTPMNADGRPSEPIQAIVDLKLNKAG